MKYGTRVKPTRESIADRADLAHYKGAFGEVSSPSPNDGEHVMVFWALLGVSSVWAISNLEIVKSPD